MMSLNEEIQNVKIQNWRNTIEVLKNDKIVFEHLMTKKREDFKSINEVRDHFCNDLIDSDIKKLWAVYVWVAHNFEFDKDGYKGDTINSLYNNGKVLYEGFANIFQYICKALGFRCDYVKGLFKGENYLVEKNKIDPKKINQHWNKVNLGKEKYFVHVGFAATRSKLDGGKTEFRPFFFLVPPEVFIYSFYPEDRIDQGLTSSNEVKRHDWIKLPQLAVEFFFYNFRCSTNSHCCEIVSTDSNPVLMEFEAPDECTMKGELIRVVDKKKCPNNLFIQRDFNTKKFIVEVLPISRESLILYLKGRNQTVKDYSLIANFLIKAEKIITPQPPLYCKTFFLDKICLIKPKTIELKAGTEYTFKVEVKENKVALLNDQSTVIGYFNEVSKSTVSTVCSFKYTPDESSKVLKICLDLPTSFKPAFEYQIV